MGKHNLPLTFNFHASKGGLLTGGHGSKQELALAIILEKQKYSDSKWAPLFGCLPKKIENLAVFSDAHRRAVNSSDVGKKFEHFDELYNATRTFVRNAKALFTPLP